MPLTTDGTFKAFTLTTDDQPDVRVRAPGLIVVLDRPSSTERTTFDMRAAKNDSWVAATRDNDIEPLGDPVVVRSAVSSGSPLLMTTRRDDTPHIELSVAPDPGDGVLLMVEKGETVQWFLPESIPATTATVATFGAERRQVRFHVPVYAMSGRTSTGITTFSVGSAVGAVVHFFRFRLIPELLGGGLGAVLQYIANKVEAREKTEGLYHFPANNGPLQPVTSAELEAMSGKRVLLLVHGIFSSIEGAFRELPDGVGIKDGLLDDLLKAYGGRIIGFDHWTIAHSPLENAEYCLSLLAEKMDLDIVCHSRGALVVRAMLEHPKLNDLRQGRINSVRNAVFVAGANQGSQLADTANWNRLFNIFYALGSIPALQGAGIALRLIVGVLKVLAHGASELPSIEALVPDPNRNEFLRDLDGPNPNIVGRYLAVHANFRAQSPILEKILDLGIDFVFRDVGNDMVVPFAGAVEFDPGQTLPLQTFQYGSEDAPQSKVWHTVFFGQPDVRNLLRELLIGETA